MWESDFIRFPSGDELGNLPDALTRQAIQVSAVPRIVVSAVVGRELVAQAGVIRMPEADRERIFDQQQRFRVDQANLAPLSAPVVGLECVEASVKLRDYAGSRTPGGVSDMIGIRMNVSHRDGRVRRGVAYGS
jgi:hypothetical protein